jgi:hypothetical protein
MGYSTGPKEEVKDGGAKECHKDGRCYDLRDIVTHPNKG